MRTSLKQLCEAAKQRNTWELEDGFQIRNSHRECPIVAGYIVLTGKGRDSAGKKWWNSEAKNLAEEIGLTVEADSVMGAADWGTWLTPQEKALRTRMMRYLGLEEVES